MPDIDIPVRGMAVRPRRLYGVLRNAGPIKLLICNAAIGFAAAVMFVALLLITDTNGLGTLISRSETGAIAVAMLTSLSVSLSPACKMGWAVMLAVRDDR